MSTTSLKKQSSYSQFRKKNSLSKNNLHKSLVDIQNSLSLIADEKTQELSSIEQQLQNIVRNRSLSNKPSAKSVSQTNIKLTIAKTIQPQNARSIKPRRNSLNDLNPYQIYQKTARSINGQGLSQTFEIIEESQMHNEQDNGFNEAKQQLNENLKKIKTKYEKSSMQKKKDYAPNNSIMNQKIQSKASIHDLDQMQKRLESAKKNKKVDIKQRKIKKQQLLAKPIVKPEKRLIKTASQSNFLLVQMKNKATQLNKQKQITPKLTTKKKILPSTESNTLNGPLSKKNIQNETTSLGLIPTKIATSKQKQKLLQQMQKIKQQIKSSQIQTQNIEKIKKMLKGIEQLIN